MVRDQTVTTRRIDPKNVPPTIIVDQSSSNVKASSNYGEFSREDARYNFKPAEGEAAPEGGRKYTPEQMRKEFIGRYANENPKVTKGLKIAYGLVIGRMGQEAVVLMKNGEVIGRLTWVTDKQYTDKPSSDIAVEVQPEHQGKGYQHLLYSEAYEN